MHIAIFGTGYVGLVTGADFACRGVGVTCVDIDVARIANLQKGVMPFFEAGLPELVARGVAAGHLAFTTDGAVAMADADVVFCAVGTPTSDDGRADLSAVFSVADLFAQHAKDGAVLVNKSTVPVGTADACRLRIENASHHPQPLLRQEGSRSGAHRFAVVSNPEFLSQSTAVHDTAHPTRIVVGAEEGWARDVLRELNASFIADGVPYVETSAKSAEAVKCAANAFLATKISFMNEVANFCEAAGADVTDVATVLGLDPRIGPQFLRAGIGYGGGCLSKDVRALITVGESFGYAFTILPAVEAVNDAQKNRFYKKFSDALGGVNGKTIAVWGLSFKPGTDDMRNAPSVTIVQKLLDDGATVRAFDPAAMERSKKIFPSVTYATDALDAARNADAIVILTEWNAFRETDVSSLSAVFSGSVIADGRGVLRGKKLPSSVRIISVGVDK